MANTDHLGRETATTSPKAQTVTGFAVEQGTLDAADVKDALAEEKRQAEKGTQRAERVSKMMAPAEDPTPVATEEGGGRG